jgi:hypothetical protein
MKKTWKPIAAAVLMLAACFPYCVASTRWFQEPGFFPETMGGGSIWPWLGLILLFPFALPLIAGAICALVRSAWIFTMVGVITPLLFTALTAPFGWVRIGPEFIVRHQSDSVRTLVTILVYAFIIAAALLLYLSRKEFSGRKSSAEHLFGPPKKYKDMVS